MAIPKILDLEIEVLTNILEFVDDESPRSTGLVAQVCKHFNLTVQLIQYRRLTVHWEQARQSWVNSKGQPQKDWETPDLLRGLRHLTVCKGDLPTVINDISDEDDNNDGSDEDETLPFSTTIDTAPFHHLETVLCNASNLRTLLWKVGYLPPHEVTETLEAHQPKAQLNIFRAIRLADPVGLLRSEKALAESSCLNTFSMTANDETYIEDHMTFQVIVALAPKLKFASLVSQPLIQPGDLENPGRFRANPELWFPKGQENRKPNSTIRHLTLDGWSLSSETLEYWSRYVDLSGLESFKCSRGSIYASYFRRAPKVLTNLKHVSLNLNPQERNPETAAAIEHYIATCPALASLSLWAWRGGVSLSTILSQHGSTLTGLHLHEREDSWFPLRDALSFEELQSIRESCPKLETFTFDINRMSPQLSLDDYVDTMKELRSFNLDNLQIYLDCGLPWLASIISPHPNDRTHSRHDSDMVDLPGYCNGDDEYAAHTPIHLLRPNISNGTTSNTTSKVYPPSTNKEICQFLIKTWKAVFGSQTTGLRQLDLKVGEWERKHVPVFRSRALRDVRVWCRARPHERDDMQGECIVEIECCGGEHKRKFVSN